MKILIYTLSDPNTKEVRYVGKTQVGLKTRLKGHVKEAKKLKLYSSKWINSLLVQNKHPIIELLDIVNENDWCFWEEYWISQFKSWGFKLTNLHRGGTGGDSICIKNNAKIKGKNTEVYNLKGDLLKVFKYPTEAALYFKADPSSVLKCCNNKSWSSNNLLFRYEKDVDKRLTKPNIVKKPIVLTDDKFKEIINKIIIGEKSRKEIAKEYNIALVTIEKRISKYLKENNEPFLIKKPIFIYDRKGNFIEKMNSMKDITIKYKILSVNILASINRGIIAKNYYFSRKYYEKFEIKTKQRKCYDIE
jgi:hypothetical protein